MRASRLIALAATAALAAPMHASAAANTVTADCARDNVNGPVDPTPSGVWVFAGYAVTTGDVPEHLTLVCSLINQGNRSDARRDISGSPAAVVSWVTKFSFNYPTTLCTSATATYSNADPATDEHCVGI